MSHPRLRATLTGLMIAGAAVLAACTTPPSPPPPPPPPPPTPPAISLSTAVIQDAAVFQSYLARAGQVAPTFKSPQDVAQALSQTDAVSPDQLLRGEIAYAAIAALQDPTYVASVRAFAADPMARQGIVAQILNNPGYAVAFKGSDSAAGLAIAAVKPAGRKLFDAGVAMKQFAYDVQHQDWSKTPVADRPQRLANAKNASLVNAVATLDEISGLRAAAVGQSPIPLKGEDPAPPYPPVIVRGLAVAALAALGEAGDDNLINFAPLMTDAPTATCLNTAKLNLYQCLAVARPNYEDVFCLGQHAMADTGQCVMIAAGAPAPAFIPPPVFQTTTTPPKPAKAVRRRRHG